MKFHFLKCVGEGVRVRLSITRSTGRTLSSPDYCPKSIVVVPNKPT